MGDHLSPPPKFEENLHPSTSHQTGKIRMNCLQPTRHTRSQRPARRNNIQQTLIDVITLVQRQWGRAFRRQAAHGGEGLARVGRGAVQHMPEYHGKGIPAWGGTHAGPRQISQTARVEGWNQHNTYTSEAAVAGLPANTSGAVKPFSLPSSDNSETAMIRPVPTSPTCGKTNQKKNAEKIMEPYGTYSTGELPLEQNINLLDHYEKKCGYLDVHGRAVQQDVGAAQVSV